ncbi:MAG: ABC transporter ATP-binding protein [Erysipelotrichaceae bacterium]|jgi:ATP-binding cassette subfamily B protein|nr:ABC transporter ATP-binding protein [Erysipelotrichaceae bacterium]
MSSTVVVTTVKKEKNKLGSLVKAFRKYYVPFAFSIALLIVSVVFTILTPGTIRSLTNEISPVGKELVDGKFVVNFDNVTRLAVTLVIYVAISFVTGFISGFILNTIIQKFSKDLRRDISAKINKMPLDYFDTTQTGDILSVITNDVDTLSTSLQNSVSMLVNSGVMLVGVIIAMFIASWQMALVVLASLPIMLIIVMLTFKRALPLFDENQRILGEVNAVVEENYSGQLVIKAFTAEEMKIEEFKKKNNLLGTILYKSQAIGGLIEPAMSFVSYLTYAAVLIAAGLLFANGSISDIGIITGFIVYVSLFQEPLAQIGQASSTIQLGTAACNRVFNFLEKPELDDDSAKPQLLDHKAIRGEVEFKDVCFGYDPNKLTIKNFSGKIKPGMKVAIIGPTGAGKTTLVNLLMRFYELTSGDILVDGVSIKEMSRAELRDIFGMILQETWVINGSLRENVVYNLQNVDENRLKEILEETNLSHYVATLPEGLDTVIQKESALSAGQKQLVTIARAMTENAPMLILDEATSNVDTRTEILIQKAMDSLTKGRTSFVIAHRLSTIKNADLIFVMKDGNIVETGNHDSLMKLGGLYSEIYNSQFN